MAGRRGIENVDPALLSRIARLSPGGQRWLKTAMVTMRTMPVRSEEEQEREVEAPPPQLRKRPQPRTAKRPPEAKRPPDMEDIITGRVDFKELDKYPELAEQLEGMGEVIDLLRGLGETRRRKGEQILRDEILGDGEGRERLGDEEEFSF